jgi:YbgC/YbaW family acyl-CoA thioester hydrolase
MADPFRTRRRVDFADTDMAGIVHFANFFRYMEAAEVEFTRTQGLSVVDLPWEGQKLTFPRVAASCDYFQPARFDDVLDITVSVRKIGKKSITYGFEFFKEGEVIARGQISAVCCRVLPDQQIESVEIPASIRERLQAHG